MSWGEILKALNKDPNKSLDTLIKEQFNNNFGTSGDVHYIKNTQLGTNLNNLLQGSNSSTINFNNKPLVDKVNYLLLCSGNLKYDSSGNLVIKSYISELNTRSGHKEILRHTFSNSGAIKLTLDIKRDSYHGSLNSSERGIVISRDYGSTKDFVFKITKENQNDYSNYVNKNFIINVNKGETIIFYLEGGSQLGIYCRNFKLLGDLKFFNPY